MPKLSSLNPWILSDDGNKIVGFKNPDGTEGTSFMTGNVGIGTTSPALQSGGTGITLYGSLNSEIKFLNSSTGQAATDGTALLTSSLDFQINNREAGGILFGTSNTERARIDLSGNFLVGKTLSSGGIAGIELVPAGQVVATRDGAAPGYFNRLTSDGSLVSFNRSNIEVGSVSVTTTATTYNTSSDYRLKDIAGPITNSGEYIDSLRPVEGTWKVDGSVFVGLIAHEAQAVSRTTVATGEKDGEDMQSLAYGNAEFIANIIAELQSLRARVAQIEGA